MYSEKPKEFKKFGKKGKALVAEEQTGSWSDTKSEVDSENSSSEEEEIVNLCLMAKELEEEEEENSASKEDEVTTLLDLDKLSFAELKEAAQGLILDIRNYMILLRHAQEDNSALTAVNDRLETRNGILSAQVGQHDSLSDRVHDLELHNRIYQEQIANLLNEKNELNAKIASWNKASIVLDSVLDSQLLSNKSAGLGFNSQTPQLSTLNEGVSHRPIPITTNTRGTLFVRGGLLSVQGEADRIRETPNATSEAVRTAEQTLRKAETRRKFNSYGHQGGHDHYAHVNTHNGWRSSRNSSNQVWRSKADGTTYTYSKRIHEVELRKLRNKPTQQDFQRFRPRQFYARGRYHCDYDSFGYSFGQCFNCHRQGHVAEHCVSARFKTPNSPGPRQKWVPKLLNV